MANKKEKKESVTAMANRLIKERYQSSNEPLVVIVQVGIKGKGLSNCFAAINKTGMKIFEHKNEDVSLVETYEWTNWQSASVDKFAIKAVIEFDGRDTFSLLDNNQKEALRFIENETDIQVEYKERKFVNKIPGFRSQKKWKMATASIMYFFLMMAVLTAALSDGEETAESEPSVEAVAVENNEQNNDNNNERNDEDNNNGNNSNENIEEAEEEDFSEILEFEGEFELKASEDKITMVLNSNVPDGGLFEIAIMDGEFNTESNVVEIENGTIEYDFPVEKFDVGYVSGMAQFRFNLEDHPQPDHIKEIYGENGEHMTGSQATENNLDGMNGSLESSTIAYPDEETVSSKLVGLFDEAIEEIITTSEGIIIDIRPMGDDWKIVDVIVSDDWYYSADHEKERFAEQVGGVVEQLVTNSELADGVISVYFKDAYGKELAAPGVFGGYKIRD